MVCSSMFGIDGEMIKLNLNGWINHRPEIRLFYLISAKCKVSEFCNSCMVQNIMVSCRCHGC